MLTVYRSNRAEWLSAVLSEQLRLNPPDPFERVEVIVNTWPTSRWLSEQIAIANGISAQISFPFPNAHLTKLVQLYLGLEVTANDPWKASQLVWTIIEVLPELLQKKEAKSILSSATKDQLTQNGLIAEIDIRNEKIGYKIREHSNAKVPVILAVGKKEADEKTVSVRRLGSQETAIIKLDELIKNLQKESLSTIK